jgi:hypothetical protein
MILMSPGARSDTSTSTDPLAARALSLGAKVATKGTAEATAAMPPAAAVAISQTRRSGSPGAAVSRGFRLAFIVNSLGFLVSTFQLFNTQRSAIATRVRRAMLASQMPAIQSTRLQRGGIGSSWRGSVIVGQRRRGVFMRGTRLR